MLRIDGAAIWLNRQCPSPALSFASLQPSGSIDYTPAGTPGTARNCRRRTLDHCRRSPEINAVTSIKTVAAYSASASHASDSSWTGLYGDTNASGWVKRLLDSHWSLLHQCRGPGRSLAQRTVDRSGCLPGAGTKSHRDRPQASACIEWHSEQTHSCSRSSSPGRTYACAAPLYLVSCMMSNTRSAVYSLAVLPSTLHCRPAG